MRILIYLLFSIISSSAFVEKPMWCKNLPRPVYKKLHKIQLANSWFEVYLVQPDVFAIYEPHQSEETISYLIVGTQKAVLFDTGMGIGNIQSITNQLTKLPLMVINSHTHPDHIGDNWRFNDIYGMDTAFTRANAAQGNTIQAEIAPTELCGELPVNFDTASYSTKPFQINHVLHDEDMLYLGNRTLKVIHTPGHTPDSIVLLDKKNKLLFTGDTFYPGPIYLFRPETDLAAYIASIQKLANISDNLQLLLPGHNIAVAKPDFLPRIIKALQDIRAGVARPSLIDGKYHYSFDEFSFVFGSQRPVLEKNNDSKIEN